MVQPPSQENIWVAAGNGDLDRVKELVESQGMNPNIPDPFSYTPMHAAASYGQLQVLDYLVSQGGNVNITDSDGDTPLYTVEDPTTAQWLVHHGAIIEMSNNDGTSPIESLSDDFPDVVSFLRIYSSSPTSNQTSSSLDHTATTVTSSSTHIQSTHPPSQHAQNQISENLTSSLLTSVQERFADRQEIPSDEELTRVVSEAVFQGMREGYHLGNIPAGIRDASNKETDESGVGKRRRLDE